MASRGARGIESRAEITEASEAAGRRGRATSSNLTSA